MTGPICVVIPAFNAADTVATTIRSVLREPEVGAVVVVDDCSSDDTPIVARSADDGTGRLTVLRHEQNQGPSAARNLAIAQTDLPLLAIVDADDLILPGRFASLLAVRSGDWDFVADDITFVAQAEDASSIARTDADALNRRLGLEEFVLGNIAEPGRYRGELGFLKPLFRRAFLERHGLGYDTRLRLGEDYILYARALSRGARFIVSSQCGYVAVQRAGSLSGQHRTQDLEALWAADIALRGEARDFGITGGTLALLDRHAAALAEKVAARRLLDEARQRGRTVTLGKWLATPSELLRGVRSLQRDRRSVPQAQGSATRRLLDPGFFS